MRTTFRPRTKVKAKFIEAYNKLIPDRERLIEDCRLIQETLTDCTELDAEIAAATEETDIIAGRIERAASESPGESEDQAAYISEMIQRYDEAKAKLNALLKKNRKNA